MASAYAPIVIPSLRAGPDCKTPHDDVKSSLSPTDSEHAAVAAAAVLPPPYRVSWRTVVALAVLNVAFASTVFAILGPNSSIPSIVLSFTGQQPDASWIASAPNLCFVSLPVLFGALSDRYGAKWFIVIGSLVGVVGCVVSGSAQGTLYTLIAGQVITFAGSSGVVLAVPAMMEAVPAKTQGGVFGLTMLINTLLGSVGGTLVYAACVQHGLDMGGHLDGWRWGFYVQAVVFASGGVLVALGYHPPPPRLGRNQTFKECLRSIDFIGLLLLVTGTLLLTLALTWGGVTFAWNDRRVTTLLWVGPLVLLLFSIYEWKGRSDGLMHHAFFWTRNFPILLVFGFVDGMLLFSTSVFIPNQIHALYADAPLGIALLFLPFQVALAVGSFAFGALMSSYKRFRLPLIIANVAASIFCSLLVFSTPETNITYEMLIAMVGLVTASTTVFPVAGIAAVSPPYLTATSVTILACFRSVGGSLGIAIPTAIYNNQMSSSLSTHLFPLLQANGIAQQFWPRIEQVAIHSPHQLPSLPFIASSPNATALSVNMAHVVRLANTESFKFVWVGFASVCGACLVLSLFLQEVPERFTNHVESQLESRQVEATKKLMM